MSRINKTQKYAIQWLLSNGMENSDIAKELKIDIRQIEKISKSMSLAQDTNSIEENQTQTNTRSKCVYRPSAHENKTKTTALDMMITKTSSKGTKSVCIMTKEASEISDAAKKKNK